MNDPLFGINQHPSAMRASEPQRLPFDELQARIDKQNLMIQALARLLIAKGVIGEDEFKEWVAYIDEFDGRRDGKLHSQRGVAECPACNRKNPGGSSKCMYCGKELPAEILDANRSKTSSEN